MAKTVQIRSRSWLPDAGYNSSGDPKQGKQRVVANVAVTSYTANGEPFVAKDVGLTTIDNINVTVVSVNDAATGTSATTSLWGDYSYSAGLIRAGIFTYSSGIVTLNTSTQASVWRVEVIGDSAVAPELLP